jgi:hypothetical protein
MSKPIFKTTNESFAPKSHSEIKNRFINKNEIKEEDFLIYYVIGLICYMIGLIFILILFLLK